MCGIAGFWNRLANDSSERLQSLGTAMTMRLVHRGPDSGGLWLDPARGLALGHRRLAIRDLSSCGNQPMWTENESHVLAYNGEIYNSEELRAELSRDHGIVFRGTADTETVLHGCMLWGVEAFIRQSIGMFAFVFWDAARRRLTLVRDRLGIKPLYYAQFGDLFLFASELKALCAHDGWRPAIAAPSAAEMLTYGYIMGERSIYESVYKLEPGCLLEIGEQGPPRISRYWSAREVMLAGQADPFSGTEEEMVEATELLLRDAVKRRMRADVPLGAFVSGGIDSSLVTALMQDQSAAPVNTFSIGFEEEGYNEAPHAKAVARHLGANHCEQYMLPREAWEVIPHIAELYDEPFSDSSQLPTYLLCAMTRRHVALALSGDGGDELFAGYGRYFVYGAAQQQLPSPVGKLLHKAVHAVPPGGLKLLGKLAPGRYRDNFGQRLRNYVDRLAVDPLVRYRQQMAVWPDFPEIAPGVKRPLSGLEDRAFLLQLDHFMARMQAADSLCYLPDDILVKVDRASMAVSLEARVPLLDHRVFAHAWRLPMHMKVREDGGKWILRRILHKYVPAKLVDRPKMGFGVPIDVWLRGPLRGWVEDLLCAETLRRENFINADLVRSIWAKHLAGENHCYSLWSVLMFQAWRNYWFNAGNNKHRVDAPSFTGNRQFPEAPLTVTWARARV